MDGFARGGKKNNCKIPANGRVARMQLRVMEEQRASEEVHSVHSCNRWMDAWVNCILARSRMRVRLAVEGLPPLAASHDARRTSMDNRQRQQHVAN